MKRKIPKAKPEYNSKGERVYCLESCRKPDDGNFMIGCDSCDEWFPPSLTVGSMEIVWKRKLLKRTMKMKNGTAKSVRNCWLTWKTEK